MPQRASMLSTTTSTPFGPSYFSNNWSAPRSRANTLQSIRSSGAPSSSAHSSRDSFADNDVKTLDYLGLVDSPRTAREEALTGASQSSLQNPLVAQLAALNDLNKNANRFRSYSVNATEQYDDEEDIYDQYGNSVYGSALTPSADVTAAQAMAIQEAVRQHNLDVQAFAKLASANRPRARTAGLLDSPSSRLLRNYLPTPSRLDSSITASDLEDSAIATDTLTDAVRQMQIESTLDNDDVLLETPTRALWLGNIPASTTVSSLNMIFGHFGLIESTRVLTHKSCGFVNYETTESAIKARSQLNNKEIFPGAGVVRIGYAKAPSAAATPGGVGAFASPSPDPNGRSLAETSVTSAQTGGLRPNTNINAETAAAALKTPKLRDLRSEIYAIIQDLGATKEEHARIVANVEQAVSYDLYHSDISAIPEPNPNRMHDAPRLREIRKRIDNSNCSQEEIEGIAMDMLPEIAELSSDYLGNTVVQKLFEHCSEPMKEAMLENITPYLAEIGIHKNGTWAAQKIIDVAKTPAQMGLIADALRPHAVQLFLDQYGNYVMQCCLRFGDPMNGFIFDVMLHRLWEIAQGRFGARAMRACLESHFATKDQQRMMAAAIALHSVQLATNANGALLLTWFLDTCTFPRRRSVLAPRLISHLVHLCTHKVAYLTVLKIINQRNEPEAKDSIVQALFFSPEDVMLQDILSDQNCGATFVYKVVTTPFLDEKIRPQVLENVRNVLLRLKAQPQQGYKRLMDEVGLSTRHGGTPSSREQSRTRSASRGRMPNGHIPHLDSANTFTRQQFSNMPQQAMDRASSVDSNAFDPYGVNNLGPSSYTHSPAMATMSPMNPQQIQYQQVMLAQQQAAAMNAQRANGFYGSPNMPMSGFSSPAPSMDPFGRPGMSGSPVPGGIQSGFPPPNFNPMANLGGYQYQMGGYYPQQPGQVGGQRRGRVSYD